ncbi:hypothetical protein ABX014_03605 [Snodgrassella alvi]|uniref:hypothetical protein n=1 Tax=Snodgrassella alvi TaxID=1196083 RepID=UPI003460AD66
MLFDTSAKGVVDVAVTLAAACLLNAYFAQAVFSIVVVVLGYADGLFGLLFNLNFSMLSKSRIIIKL